MFTPQEIQEKTFEKAVFGGYDMQTVDEFLEPLTEDYITLYKENAVLKSKMRVLVEKLEEYKAQEESMRKAMVSAQRNADNMIAEAERKAAQILHDAEGMVRVPEAEAVIAQEQARIDCARETALSFVKLVEQDIRGHLELLETLKTRDMSLEVRTAPAAAEAKKPFDFDDGETPLVVTKAAPAETTEQIAAEIQQNLSRMMNIEVPQQPAQAQTVSQISKPKAAMESTIKFTNLQFGRNYDPTQH